MVPVAPRLLLALISLLALLLAPGVAAADNQLTPTLSPLGRHVEATEELRSLVAVLPDTTQAKVRGIYVAFVPTPVDVSVQAACDDDGDPVVVVSDALLVLVEHVTHAAARSSAGSHAPLIALALHYARDQRAGERLLPPGAGAFEEMDSRATEILHTARFREALAGILAHELSIFLRGELACPNPTATHERGDDVWTDEEAALGQQIAARLYGGRHAERRDRDALQLTNAVHGVSSGYLGLLAFFAAMEAANARTSWTYVSQRPNARARFAAFERAMEEK
jgi:hypothetical protein